MDDYEDFGSVADKRPVTFSQPLTAQAPATVKTASGQQEMKSFDNIDEMMDIMEMLEEGKISEDDFVDRMKNINQISDTVEGKYMDNFDKTELSSGEQEVGEFNEIRKNIDEISENLDARDDNVGGMKSTSYSHMRFGHGNREAQSPEIAERPKPFMVFATPSPIDR